MDQELEKTSLDVEDFDFIELVDEEGKNGIEIPKEKIHSIRMTPEGQVSLLLLLGF